MIEVDGRRWGTAAEIAAHLRNGVTEDAVRKWVTRKGLTAVKTTDDDGRPQVLHPLDEAIAIEARPRLTGRGRPRRTTT